MLSGFLPEGHREFLNLSLPLSLSLSLMMHACFRESKRSEIKDTGIPN